MGFNSGFKGLKGRRCRPQQRGQRLWHEKVKTSSVRRDISRILRNPKVHRCVHNSQPLIRTLNQTYPVHTFLLFSVRSILTLSSHLCPGLPSGLFLSGVSTKTLQGIYVLFHVRHVSGPHPLPLSCNLAIYWLPCSSMRGRRSSQDRLQPLKNLLCARTRMP